jgi:hypothetical protein
VIEELERFNPSLLTLDYSSGNITRLKVTKKGYEVAESI